MLHSTMLYPTLYSVPSETGCTSNNFNDNNQASGCVALRIDKKYSSHKVIRKAYLCLGIKSYKCAEIRLQKEFCWFLWTVKVIPDQGYVFLKAIVFIFYLSPRFLSLVPVNYQLVYGNDRRQALRCSHNCSNVSSGANYNPHLHPLVSSGL